MTPAAVKMKSVKEQVTTMKKSDPDTMAPTPVGGTPKKTSTASGTRKKTPAPKKANVSCPDFWTWSEEAMPGIEGCLLTL